MLISDLAIFRELINNDQRATTTPLSVGIESCSLKYFSHTKFVYRKIVELLVFAWTNIVTHLLQELAFSHNLIVLIILTFSRYHMFTVLLGKPNRLFHQNRSQDSTLISVLLNAVDRVSLIFISSYCSRRTVTTTDISPGD